MKGGNFSCHQGSAASHWPLLTTIDEMIIVASACSLVRLRGCVSLHVNVDHISHHALQSPSSSPIAAQCIAIICNEPVSVQYTSSFNVASRDLKTVTRYNASDGGARRRVAASRSRRRAQPFSGSDSRPRLYLGRSNSK
eukprot:281280-Pleurochrysis_carterae.AAC.1